MTLKLGLQTGYWSAGPPAGVAEQVAMAEELGFDSMWTAEAYGSDALTPLAWWGAKTESLKLGTAIVQMSARTPAATAMAALTLDHLSNGRFILGLGASGPQVVEGWYGENYTRPLERTREYISILRAIWRREAPVTFSGNQYQLPYVGGTGLGKALKSTVHPLRKDIPIYLGAEGPKNVALAAEICDGWLPLFFAPSQDRWYRDCLRQGFAAREANSGPSDSLRSPLDPTQSDGKSVDGFEVAATVQVIIDDDVERAADWIRPFLALYMGGMGAKGQNFHFDVFARMGYEDVALKVQDLYLAGDKAAANAAIPTALVEEVALIGPKEKIAEELTKWEDTCLTTLLLSGPPQLLRSVAELVG
jgi:F420-dependent oxidoreductase-like protein